MAGFPTSIIRKTDFPIQVNATASSNTDIILAPFIDTANWTSGVAILRVFSSSVTYPTSATLKLVIQNAMTGPDDPNNILVPSGSGLLELTVAANTQNLLQVGAIPAPISRYLRVLLRATSGGTAGSITVTCAVDLLGRDA